MTRTLTCRIKTKDYVYEIEIQNGLLDKAGELATYLKTLSKRFAIITDESVASLYGIQLCESLSNEGLDIYLFAFPAGEKHKTRQTKEKLEDQLFAQRLGKDTCLIALGGGVATDIGGYLAATYCRGIPLVMIPTSLLGMVDASIGGKSGVNHPLGKNLIGSVYQPKKILIDPSVLQDLPPNELRNGVVEMIKHALVANRSYFDFLQTHSQAILSLNPPLTEQAIYESCLIKTNIIGEDEKENGIRQLLNAGHTIGHALEQLTHYSILHGEAVAIGLLVEAKLSIELGVLDPSCYDLILKILKLYELPLYIPETFTNRAWIKAMTLDKKSIEGKPRFVIFQDIGKAVQFGTAFCTTVNETLLNTTLDWMNENFAKK